MTIQITATRHRVAVMIAFMFVVAAIFAMSNMAPSVFASNTSIELSDQGHPVGKIDRKKLAMLAPTIMVLPTFKWSNVPIIPVLAIKDASMAAHICDMSPNIMAVIKQEMRNSVIMGETLSPDILGRTSHGAAQKFNQQLGKVWIKNMYLLDDVTGPVLIAAKSCRLISS